MLKELLDLSAMKVIFYWFINWFTGGNDDDHWQDQFRRYHLANLNATGESQLK